jgi:hypothetical protein
MSPMISSTGYHMHKAAMEPMLLRRGGGDGFSVTCCNSNYLSWLRFCMYELNLVLNIVHFIFNRIFKVYLISITLIIAPSII